MRRRMIEQTQTRPRPVMTLAVCGAALAAGTAAVAWAFPAPAVPHTATLHATATVVRAPAAGRVVQWLAEPGAAVEPDTPIAELTDAARAACVAEGDAAVAVAAATLAEAERVAALDLAWRTAELNRDLHAVRAEAADLLRERFDLDLDLQSVPAGARTVSFASNRTATSRRRGRERPGGPRGPAGTVRRAGVGTHGTAGRPAETGCGPRSACPGAEAALAAAEIAAGRRGGPAGGDHGAGRSVSARSGVPQVPAGETATAGGPRWRRSSTGTGRSPGSTSPPRSWPDSRSGRR